MEKIGILTCIHSNSVCTGAGCLKAFCHRTDFFSEYPGDTHLAAFMTCNGCQEEQPLNPEEDPGMLEKVERLRQEQIGIVHVGVCRLLPDKQECDRMKRICRMIEQQGIRVVRGTHRESAD